MQSLHSGSSACRKIQAQTVDAKCGSSACLKSKAETLDAKFAFWVFCLPKLQGPNLGCKVCILGLLPAKNPRPKPWMQSLHSGSSACLKSKARTLDAKFAFWVFCLPKSKAQTLDAKFAFWVFCLPKIQGRNLGCKVCILGLLPA